MTTSARSTSAPLDPIFSQSAQSVSLNHASSASDADVREAMSGNICRCGAYKNIVAAIQSARGAVQGGKA